MNNLTYFFGAGASAGTKEKPAIPILNVFNEALNDFYFILVRNEILKLNRGFTYNASVLKQISDLPNVEN